MKYFLLLALLFGAQAAFAAGDAFVAVRGEGEIKVAPDKAIVNMAVQTKAKDAKTAQGLNAKEMARVQKLLSGEFGVAAKDMQTAGFSVNPDYRYEQNGKQVFLGFQAVHNLTITLRKLDKVGELLDGLVGKGSEAVNVQFQGVNFDVENKQGAEIQALEIAMQNARARADALAKFAKRSIKSVRRISDSNVQLERPMMAFAEAKSMADASGGARSRVAPGEVTVSSNVSVEYEME